MKIPSARFSTQAVELGTGALSLEEIVGVARYGRLVAEITAESDNPESKKSYLRMMESRKWVDDAVEANELLKGKKGAQLRAYYGINTGFGSKAGREGLPKEDIPWVSRNLIVSHSTGVGDILHPEVVRAAMLLRANSLALGYSGVRPEVVNILVRLLNEFVIPIIPEYGSVGASGDLAPLSHLGLVISKRPTLGGKALENLPDDYSENGKAYLLLRSGEETMYQKVIEIDSHLYVELDGHAALRRREIEPIELTAKEGLAFNNGATFSAAIAALALYDAENVVRHAEVATAMSLEALLGFRDAFLPNIQAVRHHQGQIDCAARIMKMTSGGNLIDGNVEEDPRMVPPQDPYSLRVSPQVIGAVWDTLSFIRRIVEEEVNAVTDNPMIFMDLPQSRKYKSVSGGNFHGAPIAYVMDFLSIVMTDLGSLSERRVFRLTDNNLNFGLPSYLIEDDPKKPSRTSGLMIAQYLAAGLISDCKTLAHPDSVDSIPTSANQEDHVSMSMNAARHARKIIENIGYVVGIELLCDCIGLNWRINKLADLQGHDKTMIKLRRKKEKDRTRVDETLLRLEKQGVGPVSGIGTRVALNLLREELFGTNGDQMPLPAWGDRPTSEDRFLQPYVLRVARFLHNEVIVKQVYEAIGEQPPLSAV